ncbi:lipopolysaccharide assembly protein LapA domain-containing protein [Nocardia niigatensis]
MTETSKPSLLSRISMKQWIAIVLTVLAVIFIAENRHRVDIEFLLLTIRSPMWLVLLVTFVIGWVVGVLTSRSRR